MSASKAVADWLKDLTSETDEEIVVTGTMPPKIEISSGTEVRRYKDGIMPIWLMHAPARCRVMPIA
jgi:hypothetical protein